MKKIFFGIVIAGTLIYVLVILGVAQVKWVQWKNDCGYAVNGLRIGKISIIKIYGETVVCA